MSLAFLLNWRVWAALALAGVLAFTHLTVYRAGRHAIQAQWDAAKVAQERVAQEQTTRNIELQRAAEKHYTVQSKVQTKFLTKTITEIRDVAAPLASCPVPEPVRVRLNAAAACARGDSPGACGAGDEVPGSR